MTKLLNDDKQKDKIKEKAPEFESLGRNDRPAFMREIGEIRGKKLYTSRACFHFTHGGHLDGVVEDMCVECDDQMAALVDRSNTSSPEAD